MAPARSGRSPPPRRWCRTHSVARPFNSKGVRSTQPTEAIRAMRLLLIEDDPMIGRAVQTGLAQAGYAVDRAVDGADGAAALLNGVYDAVVLDLGLPRVQGLTLL